MASVEEDGRGGEIDGGEEAAAGLVVAGGDPPELLELGEEVLDQMARLIDVPIEVAGKSWSVTCVSMGNPHCITFVEDVSAVALETVGPQFEHNPAFPQRTNTEFIQVIRSEYVKMRVWERGAGVTLACGTGACAAVVAGVLVGKCDRATAVELPGGVLEIEWAEVSGRIYMTGPAQRVFTGCISH